MRAWSQLIPSFFSFICSDFRQGIRGGKMASEDFLTFLVDETLKLQKKGLHQLSSLELKLQDYQLDFLRGEFIPQIQVLRFYAQFGCMDIPINWSIFSVENSMAQYTLLSQHQDVDDFFRVISVAWKIPLEQLLITHDNGFCYLVGLRKGDEIHLNDLLRVNDWQCAA
jgi:hypothetical protein